MDREYFDRLTRILAHGASRRSALRAIAAGGAMTLLGTGAAVAKPGKGKGHGHGRSEVYVCHETDEGPYQFEAVPRPALKGHAKHGDQVCDNACLAHTGCNADGTCAGDAAPKDNGACDGGVCCNGARVDPATVFQADPLNCGSCGNACPEGEVCTTGTCGAPPAV